MNLLNPEKSIIELRERIKNRYEHYHLLNKDNYPIINFNTNRKNYQPLKDSFEEEFFIVRGIDRINNNIHIPSLKTFALLFTDDNYIPSLKILNTCQSFADGASSLSIAEKTIINLENNFAVNRVKPNYKYHFVGLIFLIICSISLYFFIDDKERIIFDRPLPNSTVPRNLIVEGTAENADTVWIVIRAKRNNTFWVQEPIPIRPNGVWKGQVYIGRLGNTDDIGQWFQARAFIKPRNKLKAGQQLIFWPEANTSTDIIDIIRGSLNQRYFLDKHLDFEIIEKNYFTSFAPQTEMNKEMSKKVLIIGAGGVGNVAVKKCAMNPDVFSEVVLRGHPNFGKIH